VSGILSFLMIPLVVQLCGKAVYGVYSIIFNTLSIVAMFCYAWIGQSYIRFYSQQKNQLDIVSERLLRKSLLVGFCFFVPLSILLTSASIGELIFFMPSFFLFGYYCYYLLVFQAKQKAVLIMICEIIRTAINILVALTLLQFFGNKHSIEILAVALFFSYLLPLMILIYKNKLNKVELDNKSVQAITKQIVQFGIPIALFLSGSLALSVNDRFLISYLINKESAGTYAAIYDVMNKGVIAVFSPILMTFYPVIAKLYNEKKEEEAFLKLKKLLMLEMCLMAVGFVLLIFVCPYLLKIVFKQEASPELFQITYLIFIGVCLWQIAMLVHKRLELKSQTKYMAIAVFIAFLVNVTANYFFLKTSNNLMIPAITTIAGSVVYIILVKVFSQKNFFEQ